jgi:hypothetical protein
MFPERTRSKALTVLVGNLACRAPVLVFLDDMHLAGSAEAARIPAAEV